MEKNETESPTSEDSSELTDEDIEELLNQNVDSDFEINFPGVEDDD